MRTISQEQKASVQKLAESSDMQSAGKAGVPDSLKRMAMILLALDPAAGYTQAGIAKRLERAKAPSGWQKRLDKALFDLDITAEQRVRLLQRVAQKSKKVSSDLRVAVEEIQEKGMGKGHPLVLDLLFPTGTTVRSDLEGLLALRKQVPEVLDKVKPPKTEDVMEQLSSPLTSPDLDPVALATQLADLATDPKKRKEIAEELKNALRSTPKGLEAPRYKVVRRWAAGDGALDGEVELRAYEPFSVVRKAMGRDGGFSTEKSAEGFNALAKYLFGGNQESTSMAMTMPVEIETKGDGESSMAFVLPRANSKAPPVPNAAELTLDNVPAKLVAVKAFPGIATEEEVERQLLLLRTAIEADGSTKPLDDGYTLLQYNAPYTVPWRRRNEVAIAVDEAPDPVASWYDSGVRLQNDGRDEEEAGDGRSEVER